MRHHARPRRLHFLRAAGHRRATESQVRPARKVRAAQRVGTFEAWTPPEGATGAERNIVLIPVGCPRIFFGEVREARPPRTPWSVKSEARSTDQSGHRVMPNPPVELAGRLRCGPARPLAD